MVHSILVYIGFFLGIFLEGEFVFISAIIAARHGYLNIWLVISIAMLATIISGVFYFNLGKKKASKCLNQSKWAPKLEKVQKQLVLHRTKFLISYRFIYGFRIATPLVLGTQNLLFREFLKYSIISTSIWAVLLTVLGLLFGEIILKYFKYIQKIEYYIIGGLLLLAVGLIVSRLLKKKALH